MLESSGFYTSKSYKMRSVNDRDVLVFFANESRDLNHSFYFLTVHRLYLLKMNVKKDKSKTTGRTWMGWYQIFKIHVLTSVLMFFNLLIQDRWYYEICAHSSMSCNDCTL
jgi:hypothetical protein